MSFLSFDRIVMRHTIGAWWPMLWRGLASAINTTWAHLEIGLVLTEHELAQWPDGWVIDKHGDADGNNPHVWLPWELLVADHRTTPMQIFSNRMFLESGEDMRLHDDGLTYYHGQKCPCGLVLSDLERKLAQMERLKRKIETLEQKTIANIERSSDIASFVEGLIRRDVQ